MTAIRGLGHIALRDDRAAEHLAKFARHDELPLREQALATLASVIKREKDEARLAKLMKLFPGEYTDWLPLEAVSPPHPVRN